MDNIKTLNIRIPYKLWAFIRKSSFKNEQSINALITDCLFAYEKKCKKAIILKKNSKKVLRKSDANGIVSTIET